jgi:hypothetical protein
VSLDLDRAVSALRDLAPVRRLLAIVAALEQQTDTTE